MKMTYIDGQWSYVDEDPITNAQPEFQQTQFQQQPMWGSNPTMNQFQPQFGMGGGMMMGGMSPMMMNPPQGGFFMPNEGYVPGDDLSTGIDTTVDGSRLYDTEFDNSGVIDGDAPCYYYKFYNISPNPVWVVDGTMSRPKLVPPLMLDANTGKTSVPVPEEYKGNIMLFVKEAIESQETKHINKKWHTIHKESMTTVPVYAKDMNGWSALSWRWNLAFFGTKEAADAFVQQYGSLMDYAQKTNLATRYTNGVTYSIVNCTGKTLWQLDDTTAFGNCPRAQAIELESGPDTELPIWEQQKAINEVANGTRLPYVKMSRHIYDNSDGREYDGYRTEDAIVWDSNILDPIDRCLFIPYMHTCLFERRQDAVDFVNKYGTVDKYYRLKIIDQTVGQFIWQQEQWKVKTEQKYRKRFNLKIADRIGGFASLVLKAGLAFFSGIIKKLFDWGGSLFGFGNKSSVKQSAMQKNNVKTSTSKSSKKAKVLVMPTPVEASLAKAA